MDQNQDLQECGETMKDNLNGIMKIIGIVLLFIIIIFSIYNYFIKKEISDDEKNVFNENNMVEAKIINGKQVAELSWGKFNYNPDIIKVKVGMPVQIVADMERLQGCFRSILIPDLGINENLNENDNILEFTPEKKGTFNFGCAMGMGNGKLVVE